MSELRISNMESRIEIGSPQTTKQKNDMETPESKQKTLILIGNFINCVTVVTHLDESLLNKIGETDCVKQCYIVHLDTWNSYVVSFKTIYSSRISETFTSHFF